MKTKPKFWKIVNRTGEQGAPRSQAVKIVVRVEPNASKAVILEPGKFVVAMAQNTTALDAQRRKNFVTVDEDFDNDEHQLELGKQYAISYLQEIKDKTDEYMK